MVLTRNSCVFVNHIIHTIIGLYVNDLLIFAKTIKQIDAVKSLLNAKYKMKDLGLATFILGIQIWQQDNWIILDQSNYIQNFFCNYQIDETYPLANPIKGYKVLSPLKLDKARTDQLEY